ncbi:uncharacterized protein [Nicotiana tomentosiformis]|uniref:uncharacterized protein n=1 Tax=Nicotiana tomentosiformis TaxID=4098 RepID=UPI00388CBA95
MAFVLHYVNKEGELIERFLGLVHNKGTTAHALQKAIYSLILQHSLSSSLIRRQGYDRASNMQGEINGLKTLILKDNPSAYFIHCFAHQLQSTLVAVAKKHHDVNSSYKLREILRDDQAKKLDELLLLGDDQRPGDTHWGSHCKILRNFISLFSSIVHILGVLANVGSNYQEKALAKSLVEDIRSYEQLQTMRESKWKSLIEDVSLFCDKNGIVIPKMDEKYALGKLKCKSSNVTYSYHLYVEVFCAAIDLELSELNNCFSEVNIDLVLGMASLSTDDSFANYDKNKIMKHATYYPNEFTASNLEDLSCELDNYIDYVREMDNAFSNLKGHGDMSKTLVKTNIHKT